MSNLHFYVIYHFVQQGINQFTLKHFETIVRRYSI